MVGNVVTVEENLLSDGVDFALNRPAMLFTDGFENGQTSSWSSTIR
jgi:hypothetical protein